MTTNPKDHKKPQSDTGEDGAPTMKEIIEIFEFLPHRYPFLLVDRVLNFERGSHISGFKNVTVNEEMFNGHFPRQPIMPGVLMIEALAQLSGILAFETKGTRPADGNTYFLGGADKARFKRPVVPGDRLMMESRIIADRTKVMKFDCQAYVDSALACTAELIIVEQIGPASGTGR